MPTAWGRHARCSTRFPAGRSGPSSAASAPAALVGLFEGFRETGRPVVPVFAKPVNIVRTPEAECCSFSGRIPGVVDQLSAIFCPDRLPGLRTVEVDDEAALAATRRLIRLGYPVGPSSGLNYLAAVATAAEVVGPVVTVFPDRMERYFMTELFRPYAD